MTDWMAAAAAAVFLAGCVIGGFIVSYAGGGRRREIQNELSACRERERRLSERAAGAEKVLESERENAARILGEFRLAAVDVLSDIQKKSSGDLAKDRALVENSVKAMGDHLSNTVQSIRDFQNERKKLEGELVQSVKTVLDASQSVNREMASLKQAMISGTGVRGLIGQSGLEQLLEESGLQKGLHFETQKSLPADGETSLRPDFIIHLPGDRRIAVDAKEVAGEYLQSLETDDEDRRREHLGRLVQNFRDNFMRLSKKDYASRLDPSIPFVLMFVSNESAFRAALSTDPSLYREARSRSIYLTSPMTIVPMIQLVALAWQEHKLAQNAEELGEVVEELGSRLFTFMEHLQNIGRSIGSSVEWWDKAVGSWDRSITPQLERVRDLGGKFEGLRPPAPLNRIPRAIQKIESSAKNVLSAET